MSALVARSEDAAGAVLYLSPGGGFAEGAALVCAGGDVAVFLDGGGVAGVLGAGSHPLLAASVPFLRAERGWVSSRVLFVATARAIRLVAQVDLGTHGDPELLEFFGARAEVTVAARVLDPALFAKRVAAPMGLDGDGAFAAWLRGVVEPAVRDAYTALVERQAGPPPRAVVRLLDDEVEALVSRPLRGRLDAELSPVGMRIEAIESVRVHIEEPLLLAMLTRVSGMKVVRCRTCQGLAAHYCGACGKHLLPKEGGFCAECGAEMNERAKFCAGCGAPPTSLRMPSQGTS